MIKNPNTILDLYQNKVYNQLQECDLYVFIDKNGKTLLHKIVADGALDVLYSLINAKVIVPEMLRIKSQGETPKDIAVKKNDKKMVEALTKIENENDDLEELANEYGSKIKAYHNEMNKKEKIKGGEYSESTDINIYEKIHEHRQNQMFQLQDMIEQSRMNQNEGSELINKTIDRIMEIMKVNIDDAKVYKTFLYQEIKNKYSDATTSLAKAKILYDYISKTDELDIKEKLKKVDIKKLRKLIEEAKEAKFKNNTESISLPVSEEKKVKKETKEKKVKKETKEKKVKKTKKGGYLDSEIEKDKISYINTSEIYG